MTTTMSRAGGLAPSDALYPALGRAPGTAVATEQGQATVQIRAAAAEDIALGQQRRQVAGQRAEAQRLAALERLHLGRLQAGVQPGQPEQTEHDDDHGDHHLDQGGTSSQAQ